MTPVIRRGRRNKLGEILASESMPRSYIIRGMFNYMSHFDVSRSQLHV
jgi:hypothetical protein